MKQLFGAVEAGGTTFVCIVGTGPGDLSAEERELLEILSNYVRAPLILDAIDDYIVPPRLCGRAGVLGALALALQAFDVSARSSEQYGC